MFNTIVVPVLLIWMYLYIYIFVHELGHVFAAYLMGWRVVKLSVGIRHQRTLFTVGELRFQFGWIPWSGFVNGLTFDRMHFRAKNLFFVADGILANVIFALSLLFVLWRLDANQRWPWLSPYMVTVSARPLKKWKS